MSNHISINVKIPEFISGEIQKICEANNCTKEFLTRSLLVKFVKGTGVKSSKEVQETLGLFTEV